MISSLFELLTFLIFLSTISRVTGLGSVLLKDFEQVTSGSTWENAQRYCKEHFNDLATIYDHAQAENLYLKPYMAWIGLHTETSTKVWVWTDGKNHGIEWGWQEPKDNQSCGAIGYHYYYERKIYSKNCEKNLFFACQRNTTEYPFIKEMMTWSQAEEYCNNGYNGLASFATWHTTFFSEQNFPIWIGLHRNGGSWKWSLGLEEDKHWNLSNPSNDTTCVTISSVKKELATKNCQTQLPFLCTKDNMVLVKENKSWEEAFEHCQGLRSSSSSKIHFNLLSVKPGDEHTYVMNKVMEADTEEVWVGLRFLGDEWLWMNGADMLYTDMLQCPVSKKHCGALSKNDAGTVEARDCSERKNFLCYSYNP